MKLKLIIDNSFCTFSDDISEDVLKYVRELLSYTNDIGAEKASIFHRMKYAKNIGNNKAYHFHRNALKKLEETEHVCWLKDKTFPTGHLILVEALLKKLKVKCEFIDKRQRPDSSHIVRWNNPLPPLRYYQEEAINKAFELGRGVIEHSVGSGKSLIITALLKKLSVNSLIIVPSLGLQEQIYRTLVLHFGTKYIQKITTKIVRSTTRFKPFRIVTFQTLGALAKSKELKPLLKDVDALFVDETHHNACPTFANLLSSFSHIFFRFGFSGTFLRADAKTLDMWGFLATKIHQYTPKKAIADGYLTPLELITYEIRGKSCKNYQKEYNNNYCDNPKLLQKIIDIIQKYKDEQILILVSRKAKSGNIIENLLKNRNIDCLFISGDDDKKVINNAIDAYNDKKIRVLIGSNVIGEGIDIRSTDHLIMAQGQKSPIAIVQAVGRGVRLYEGKEKAFIHDFNFTGTYYMSKHFEQRLVIYKKNFGI